MSYRLSWNHGDVYRTELYPTHQRARREALKELEDENIELVEDTNDTLLFIWNYCGAKMWYEATIEKVNDQPTFEKSWIEKKIEETNRALHVVGYL